MEEASDTYQGGALIPSHHLKHGSPSSPYWVSEETAQAVLKYLHFAYPLILLVFFITTFTIHSIIASNRQSAHDRAEASEEQTGPGGKPLPKKKAVNGGGNAEVLDFSRPRKLLFEWLSLAAALTFVGNAVTVVAHALYSRSEQWWCGQATVVSTLPTHPSIPPCTSSPPYLAKAKSLSFFFRSRYTLWALSWSTLSSSFPSSTASLRLHGLMRQHGVFPPSWKLPFSAPRSPCTLAATMNQPPMIPMGESWRKR